jgi:hypothetical protein|tara:strand:- start:8013 stop:8702 length:690 start_codon:yes stop_codon:yes gene_type:complete
MTDEESMISDTDVFTPFVRMGAISISHSLSQLAPALAKAQGATVPVKAEKKSGFYDSQYGDLLAYVEGMRKSFSANGLSVVQCPSFDPDRGPNGTVEVTTMLLHESGEFIQSSMQIQPDKPGPQAVGSATTYAKRYALASMTRQVASETASGIPEDDDAESANKSPRDNPSGMKKPTAKPKKASKKNAPTKKVANETSKPAESAPPVELKPESSQPQPPLTDERGEDDW